jgi:hypothetical protein
VDEEEVSATEVLAGWTAGAAGTLMPGAFTGGDGALRSDKACGGMGACSTRSTDDISDCKGCSSSDLMAGWLGGDGDGNGGKGGEQHPSICGICLFLVKTTAQLLARVASL